MPVTKFSSFLFLLFVFFTSVALSQVLKVVDGDTIHLDGEKIRFSGIDAPEVNQTCIFQNQIIECGLTSKQLIINKIGDQKVTCLREGKDQYGRTLAECFVGGDSLSRFLVRQGFAFAYRQYSLKFITDEEFAQQNKLGMWGMDYEFPWDFRRAN